jgi:DNA-binding FrmR family transcriptional regulator
MTHSTHTTHSDVLNRLRRADGHLKAIITMIEDKRECVDVAQQLHAIGNAIENAKRIYIQDHIDNCLEEAAGAIPRGARSSLAEFKEITKYL